MDQGLVCPRCGWINDPRNWQCQRCGLPFQPTQPRPTSDSTYDGLSILVPYKNKRAMFAYYLGVFSVIPLIGIVFGLFAVISGVIGLRYAKAHPEAKGKVHCWIGIGLGAFFALLYSVAFTVLLVVFTRNL